MGLKDFIINVIRLMVVLQCVAFWVYLANHEAIDSFTRSSKPIQPSIDLLANHPSLSDGIDKVTKYISTNPALLSTVDNNFKSYLPRSSSLPLVASNEKLTPPTFDRKEIPSTNSKLDDRRYESHLIRLFNGSSLPAVDYPDLKYRSSREVRNRLLTMFQELPAQFNDSFKNPCWSYTVPNIGDSSEEIMECLPYAYLIGQPKCGTTDLFSRLSLHEDIKVPHRKEIRWFTRGEFSTTPLLPEIAGLVSIGEIMTRKLSADTSLHSYTRHFDNVVADVLAQPRRIITIDGGPHTMWWPTQSPDGALLPDDVPPSQIIREMQPRAKFIITLSDPVKRLYSDYYFLMDNRRPINPGMHDNSKSSMQLHERVVLQIQNFKSCIQEQSVALRAARATTKTHGTETLLSDGDFEEGGVGWFRASQMCAHDRHKFGLAGWGRICMGLYFHYIEKWLEHFPPDQFLVVRLEDYESDPRGYMTRIFNFLQLDEPNDWAQVTAAHRANVHGREEPILEETETLLRAFYKPYNDILARYLNDDKFRWIVKPGEATLRDNQLARAAMPAEPIQPARPNPSDSHGAVRGESGGGPSVNSGAALAGDPHIAPPGSAPAPSSTATTADSVGSVRNLRGSVEAVVDPASEPLPASLLRPRSFSLEGLTMPTRGLTHWLTELNIMSLSQPPTDVRTAGRQLAYAAIAMDLRALKYLLYDVGVPANVVDIMDFNRNAFHSLTLIGFMVESAGRSYVFNMLSGNSSWLTPLMKPPLPKKVASVHSHDIMESLSEAVIDVAKWLVRAGVSTSLPDLYRNTPLHYAAYNGLTSMVDFLLENDAQPNAPNGLNRTALHFAVAFGRVDIVVRLVEYGGDLHLKDHWGVSPLDIISNPGPITAADALKYFKITQRPVREINRVLHPERKIDNTMSGWTGNGGWDEMRLAGYESDMACDIDQYFADEITGEEIFSNYIARSSPVLIRGLLHDWGAIERWKKDNLLTDKGDMNMQVSAVPYALYYANEGRTNMTLRTYIEQMLDHKIIGGTHPWYIFKPHYLPDQTEAEWSLVKGDDCPTPDPISVAFETLYPRSWRGEDARRMRKMYLNVQWALGGEGTGAPVHYHNIAWNSLIYGAKKWLFYPPHHQIMSNMQILEYFETDFKKFEKVNVNARTCVQTAGDVVIVPEGWGHGVLNLQESVASATELILNPWRLRRFSNNLALVPM